MGLAVVVSTPRLTYPTLPSLTPAVSFSLLPQPLTGGISSPQPLPDPPLPLFLVDVSQGRCRSLPYVCPAAVTPAVTISILHPWDDDVLF